MSAEQKTKPKRVYSHPFTINIPIPLFERLEAIAVAGGTSIRDVMLGAVVKGLGDAN